MRTKVTISLHQEDVTLIERLKSRLEGTDLYFAPSTSEVMRLALQVLAQTPQKTMVAIAENMPLRRVGRPRTHTTPRPTLSAEEIMAFLEGKPKGETT
jgi:hypothetical protein